MEKMLGRIPSSTPQVSWFEFLLDKSGTLLKKHVDAGHLDPSPMQLCKQFLQKSTQPSPMTGFQPYQHIENERTRQLRFLALAVSAYIHWDLDDIHENIPLNFQYLLMTELLKSYGINEHAIISDIEPENMEMRSLMVWILFHRWIIRSVVKVNGNRRAEKTKQRTANANTVNQDEQMIPMLYGYLSHSLRILHRCLAYDGDLEIPFPKPVETSKKEEPDSKKEEPDSRKEDVDSKKEQESEDLADTKSEELDRKSTLGSATASSETNAYDDVIPMKNAVVKVQIYADLGTFYFFQEDYNDAFKNFNSLFELMKHDDQRPLKNLLELKGYFLACSMILSVPVNEELFIKESQSLLLRAENSLTRGFKGLYEILKEDNIKQELEIAYRKDIEEIVMNAYRRDLIFRVCACNALRVALDGNLLPSLFVKSLKFARKGDIFILIELCADALSVASTRQKMDYIKRSCRSIGKFLQSDMKGLFQSDRRLAPLFPAKTEEHKKIAAKVVEDTSITSVKATDSALLGDVSGYNTKDDVYFIKREIALSTNAEYLKQLVSQLSILSTGKDYIKGFHCLQYSELLSDIRDSVTQSLLHVFLTKARNLAGKQELGMTLSLLSSALEVLNQYCQNATSTGHTNRIKNVIHHEMLSAKVQWEQNKLDTSINVDPLRLCKACYHHRNQDPLPAKQIYLHIVSYLLNNKEWQFLIEEGGNVEGVTDFLQLGFELANVSVGLSKAGDAVLKHASEFWNTVIKIVCDGVSVSGKPLMAFERSAQGTRRNPVAVTRKDFALFLKTLKNTTVLSVIASCLTSILNIIKKDEHIEVLYSHIWPTTLDFENIGSKEEHILSVLRPLVNKIIMIDPRNIAWLKIKADLLRVEGKNRDAMKQYLEVGAMTSNVFNVPVPFHAWDDKIYQRMIDCCMKQKLYSQVVVLCQFIEPIDYPTVLKAIQDNGKSCDVIDTTYDCIWDPTILEFLIYAHAKRGEVEKKQKAVKTISQPELNSCNSPDTLRQTADLKKCMFLRFLTKYFWANVLT